MANAIIILFTLIAINNTFVYVLNYFRAILVILTFYNHLFLIGVTLQILMTVQLQHLALSVPPCMHLTGRGEGGVGVNNRQWLQITPFILMSLVYVYKIYVRLFI